MPPFAADRGLADAADRDECRRLIAAGSRSFAAASMLLPKATRQAAYALYAFCRVSDDAVDDPARAADAIERLRRRLDLAYAGTPAESAVDRAFADVVIRYAVPRALPEALIDGFAWDVRGLRCETESDVFAYAVRVAGSVGAMMTVLMGVRDPLVAARACDLGVAMQLTNIARDVGEDAAAGRLYLPRAWMREAGLDPDRWLARPVFDARIAAVIARLLRVADALYQRADKGIGGLPAGCRAGIFAARHLYSGIGAAVARRGFDSVSARARVPGGRKIWLIARAMLDAALARRAAAGAAPLAEAAYLVDAVAAAPAPRPAATGRLTARILWVAELFASLEARERGLG
jgi:phytoene synthase